MPLVRIVKRGLLLGMTAVTAIGYLWIAAVRAVPEIKRRKAARRAARGR